MWSYKELTIALGLAPSTGPDLHGVAIDSRLTQPGDLFVALSGDPGPRFQATSRSDRDGHDYVADAVAKGAAAALVHRDAPYGVPSLRVEDTLDGLWQIGRAARHRLGGPVLAVTGSSGKTTFKSFAATALGYFATAGSLNNHIGVPLSLARTPRQADGAVFEIGTNHPGEIEPLARLAKADVAVVLNVHPAHIGNFGTLDAIRREKAAIANGLRPDGVFVRPTGLAADFRGPTLTFGAERQADVQLTDAGGGVARLRAPAGRIECVVPGGGPHRAMSVCALAAALTALNLPLDLLHRLDGHDVPPGRGNRLLIGDIVVVDESYNANPASMAATLDAFGTEPGRRIAILGDMLELGQHAALYHRDLAGHCGDLDGVFCVGEHAQALYDALPADRRLGFADRADAATARRCARLVESGDRVLVKASNGIFWANRFVEALVDALQGERARSDDV